MMRATAFFPPRAVTGPVLALLLAFPGRPETQGYRPPERGEPPAAGAPLAEAPPVGDEAAPPDGPPLTDGEKGAFRDAVAACWNVAALPRQAREAVVVVAFRLASDGRPRAGSIRMVRVSGGDAATARPAFEAARRAILRCGARGFPLPAEKFPLWRDVEMTFRAGGPQLP